MSKEISYYSNRLLKKSFDSFCDGIAGYDGKIKSRDILEDRLKGIFECNKIITTNTSTSALHLALCAMDIKRGDKVICPVNSSIDTPQMVRHFDAEPLFIDCLPRSYNIDTQKLEDLLKKSYTKKVRAVILQHVAGMPSNIEAVMDIADRYNLVVIEDARETFYAEVGCKYSNKRRSDMIVYSLGLKNRELFDGGVLIIDKYEWFDRAKLLKNSAIQKEKSKVDYIYDILDIGCQYDISEFDAQFALALLDNTKEETQRRKEIAQKYIQRLQNLKHVTLPVQSDKHTYYNFIIEIDKNRDSFAKALKDRGIQTWLSYVPLHLSKYYKEKYNLKVFDYPVALSVYQKILLLPIDSHIEDEDIEYICEQIREVDEIHI